MVNCILVLCCVVPCPITNEIFEVKCEIKNDHDRQV